MPLPRLIGRINRRLTNPILWPIVARLPRSGFGRIVHIGRRSGRVYRTTMLSFRHGDSFVFALTYGPSAQWVQNVLAAGACDFEMRSTTYRLIEPRLLHDPDRRFVPANVGWILGRMRAYDFVVLRIAAEIAEAAVPTRSIQSGSAVEAPHRVPASEPPRAVGR